MASKFQNRLIGTIILATFGVIIFPGLLNGKKKHYQDDFAAIPLVPQSSDSDELDATPPANNCRASRRKGRARQLNNPAGSGQPSAGNVGDAGY